MYNSTDAFSQVAFKDVPQSYPLATTINCCYTLAAHFQPSPRDWVGIFKVGWSTIKDYHTFMWVESCGDSNQEPSSTRHAYFKEYYLPKDDLDFYQFCYVNSSGQVCGASTPFCFKSQHPNDEQNAANGSDNDDLMVITTQEEVEQSDREIAALKDEAHRIRQQNEELETALREERREAAILKDKHDELASELYSTKQQHERLLSTWQEQEEEIQRLKEMLTHMNNQVELQEQNLAECTDSDRKGDDGGLLLQIELQLREAQALIANKDAVIEEKNNLTAVLKRHNQELAQENQKLTDDMEELRKTLDDLQKRLTARSVKPEATEMCDISDDTPVVSIVDNDEQDQPTLMCCHCLESFPGSTRAEVECHERNHRVCPFCTLICDDMEQNVFEDHVYSHEM
ncbi:calcium-binding and coiled-coil domain-containing protein 2 isoform X1 [Syngnathus typhle]|uniref:calcium-binding and coiled-coil domain-containing protein 2 isoform X1 n=1 Tax=Syngnathus typhle TaxID=161592 RepID=UPI002A6B493D|nr:calcium-binding and coiled-coil domain-containing protein 2 isoform X1 [Syngnathus typhle]